MNDDIFQFEAPAEAAPELVLGKKKKKKKKKKTVNEDEAPPSPSAAASASGNPDPHPEEIAQPLNPAFAALEIDANGAGEEEEDKPAPFVSNDEDPDASHAAPVAVSKKKKKKKKLDLQPALDPDQHDLDPQPEPEISSQPDPQPEELAQPKRPMTAAEKKKAKKERERQAKLDKSKKEDAELDAILAELGDTPTSENPKESEDTNAAEAVPMTAAQKKRAKKKKKATADKEEDIDALMAELGGPPATAAPEQQPETAEADVDDLLAELGGVDVPATKKKAKKKKKKGAAKPEEEGGDAPAAPTVTETKKPKKKESAAVRRMREQRERMLAEEERLRRIQEEEEAKAAEEEEQRLAEIKRKEDEKARKKAAEKAKRDRKRKEGTLLSKAEKERRKKQEKFRQQLLSSGQIPGAANPTEGEQGHQKPTRIVYDRKRKPKNASQGASAVITPAERQLEVEPNFPGTEESLGEKQTETPEPELEVVPDAWDELPDPGEDPKENGNVDGNADEVTEKAGNEGEESEEDDESEDTDSEYEGMTRAEIAAEKRLDAVRKARGKEKAQALASRTADHLRSPVICILGHVDTGKTKILDRIRRTNVQDGEAGGITQQIGATYFPIDAVKKEATKLAEGRKLDYNVPSLLIIDTPGHESFTNLRSRGSSLCDIAILVVDILHGLEPQTKESIGLLKARKTPFIVALNKIDRIYDWDAQPHNCPTRDSIAKQPRHAREEFMRRVRDAQLEFAEIGFNTQLYWENEDPRKTVSLVPTSAISGEGIPDLLMLLLALPQKLLTDRLMFNPLLEATVLEVKVIEGLGTTIDVILTGGTIREGDTIMVVGLDGPIVSTIRALLTPHPMKEMRVKGQYLHHKEIKAAQGIKISAEGMDKAVAGTQLMVVQDPTSEVEMEYCRDEVMKDFETILTDVDKSGKGVYVQASTLGSLEALLEFLRTSKIPVSGINIGPVHKKDVTKASTMLERGKEYATILAFDVGVEKEARELADDTGVRIFTADIIYHLFDQFTAYMEQIKKDRREEVSDEVVFPSISRILPQHVYNKKDPIVVGVDVLEGILRVGTPLVVKHGAGWLDIGRVASLELSKKQVVTARKGESVAVKIQHKNTEHIMYGRHFDFQDVLVSKMSRPAIEILKQSFKEDLGREEWLLVVKLKKMFDII